MTLSQSLTPLRYETPTVTLVVMARPAAVSAWSEKPIVQVLRFQLQFRQDSDSAPTVEISGDRATFLPLMQALQGYRQAQLTGQSAPEAAHDAPYLDCQGLTQHRLHLGPLRTTSGDATVEMGGVQLADLGTVFDQVASQVRLLPVSVTNRRSSRPSWQWGATAAGLVAAVGLTTALWPQYQSSQLEEATPPAAELSAPPTPATPTSPAPPAAAPRSESSASAPSSAPIEPPPTAPSDLSDPADREDQAADTPDRTPRDVQTAPAPEADNSDRAASPATPSDPPPTSAGEPPSPSPEALAAAEAESAPAPTARSSSDSLAELADRLSQQWQPPDDLRQALSYQVILSATGSILEILPADAAATDYRDRVPLPPPDTPLLPAAAPQHLQIQFQPDGTVTVLADEGLTD